MKLLKLFLALGAITWIAAAPALILSWDSALAAMQSLGAGDLPHDKMLDYWLRMASGAFVLIGCIYLLLLLQPKRFRDFIPWMGGFSLMEGLVLLAHGTRLKLGPWPFYGDLAACMLAGIGILVSVRYSHAELYSGIVEPVARANDR